jgi:hypothetical protein
MLEYFQKQNFKLYKKEVTMNKKSRKFLTIFLGIALLVSALFLSLPLSTEKVQAASVSAPTVTSVSASGTTKAIVRWSKVSGCTGYRLYRRTAGSSSWKTIKTIPGAGNVSYTDTSLSPGTCYYYTVRAYKNSNNSTSWSSYNQTGRYVITNLATPSLSSAKHTAQNTVRVTWKSVSGAKGYIVYKRVNSKWVKKATITSGSRLFWNDTSAASGNSNIYTVKAYTKYGSVYKYSGYSTNGIRSNTYTAPASSNSVYYKKLASYIQKNGSTNSSGNRFISFKQTIDGTVFQWGIVYEIADDNFSFILVGNDGTSKSSVTMDVNVLKNSSVTPYVSYLHSTAQAGFMTKSTFRASSYSKSSQPSFSVYKTTGEFSSSTMTNLSRNMLAAGFNGWSTLAKKAGVTLKSLGFTSYAG